jgi:hypothetical protein
VKGLLGLHSIPAADVTANTNIRDVVGNKTDTAVTTVGTTKSLMGYVKGTLDSVVVPTADTTDNNSIRDVIGNKSDALVTDVRTTASVIAYLKGLIQELDQRKVARCASGASGNIVNISDKGVLTGIYVRGTISSSSPMGYISLQVTIDGSSTLSTVIYPSSYDSTNFWFFVSYSLAFNHRFNTSLGVALGNGQNVITQNCDVAYTIDD